MNSWRVVRRLMWKDIKIEFRGKQLVLSGIAFGVLLLFVTGMAMDGAARLPVNWSAGVLWLNVFFSTAISMTRHDGKERELGGLQGMLLAPVDRSLIYYAKWLTTSLYVLLSVALLTVAYFILLNQPAPRLPGTFALVVFGGTVGLTGIGTFLAVLTAPSTMRDILLPLLLFPLSIPLFLALIRLTTYALDASAASFPAVWAEVLGGYIVVFAVLPWLLYESLLEV